MLYCPYDYGKNGTGVLPLVLVGIRLMLLDWGSFPWALCNINRLHCLQLSTLVQHAPLWVSGHINKIVGDEITLKNARLEFEA